MEPTIAPDAPPFSLPLLCAVRCAWHRGTPEYLDLHSRFLARSEALGWLSSPGGFDNGLWGMNDAWLSDDDSLAWFQVVVTNLMPNRPAVPIQPLLAVIDDALTGAPLPEIAALLPLNGQGHGALNLLALASGADAMMGERVRQRISVTVIASPGLGHQPWRERLRATLNHDALELKAGTHSASTLLPDLVARQVDSPESPAETLEASVAGTGLASIGWLLELIATSASAQADGASEWVAVSSRLQRLGSGSAT